MCLVYILDQGALYIIFFFIHIFYQVISVKKICLIIYLLSIFVLSNFKVYAVNEEDVAKEKIKPTYEINSLDEWQ